MRNIHIFISRLMLQIYVMLKAKIKLGIANMSELNNLLIIDIEKAKYCYVL